MAVIEHEGDIIHTSGDLPAVRAEAPDFSLVGANMLCVSADLPFAAKRFCGDEGIENVYTASTFRSPEFAEDYGVRMMNGPMEGLCARSIVVIDEDGRIVHTELVSPLNAEPDYGAALSAL